MSDFEEKLNAILSNPQAMAQVASIAQSLHLDGNAVQPEAEKEPIPHGSFSNDETFSPSFGDILGKIDPALIARFLPLIGELTAPENSDAKLQLLYALRPFLKAERQEKIDRAAKAAKLLHIGKKLLTSMGDPNV